jgi:hypothetical protein
MFSFKFNKFYHFIPKRSRAAVSQVVAAKSSERPQRRILNLMDHSVSHSDYDPNLYALSIHFDGGARPDPGTGGCGFVFRRRVVGYSEKVEEGCPVKRFNS